MAVIDGIHGVNLRYEKGFREDDGKKYLVAGGKPLLKRKIEASGETRKTSKKPGDVAPAPR